MTLLAVLGGGIVLALLLRRIFGRAQSRLARRAIDALKNGGGRGDLAAALADAAKTDAPAAQEALISALAAQPLAAEEISEAAARLGLLGPRLKLALLNHLASAGDPAALPRFVAAADALPSADLPELARQMMRFGPAAYPHLLLIVNRRPTAFPPDRLAELLKLAARHG